MKDNEPKVVQVLNKYGTKILSNCTRSKAEKLVSINCADWVGRDKIIVFETTDNVIEDNKKIIAEEERVCYICNQKIPEDTTATIDHVIPRAKRSRFAYVRNNKRCCCKRCNQDKGNMTLTEYISHIEKNRDKYDYITNAQVRKLKSYAEQHERKFMFEELSKIGRIKKA